MIDRESLIIEKCRGKNVLHLGAADAPYSDEAISAGRWLHAKIHGVSNQCVGLDLDRETIEHLRLRYGIESIRQGNAESLDDIPMEPVEVIVAGEIIEHLGNPGNMLAGAKRKLTRGGELVVTTTNAFCVRRMLRVMFGWESIHPDHTCYFSHRTLENLAARSGLKLVGRYNYRMTERRFPLPYFLERMITTLFPSVGEGIIQVFRADS